MSLRAFINKLPDKTTIFLCIYFMYTWVLFQFSMFIRCMFGLYLANIPNYFVPNIPHDIDIKLIHAIDGNGNNVLNKLKVYMYFNWDKTMFEEHGGIDLDKFLTLINSSVLFLVYIVDIDLPYNEFKNLVKNIEIINITKEIEETMEYFKKHIHIALIDKPDKLIYKSKNLNTDVIKSDILFGEINFY